MRVLQSGGPFFRDTAHPDILSILVIGSTRAPVSDHGAEGTNGGAGLTYDWDGDV